MSSEIAEQKGSLKTEIGRTRGVIESLENDLAAVDAEVEALVAKRHRFELLSKACESLQELDDISAGHLFWGEAAGPAGFSERLQCAQRNIEEFGKKVAEVEGRRDALVARIGEHNGQLTELHYDLRDVLAREESRKSEWIVERDPDPQEFRSQIMPWTRGCEEDRRFRKSLAASLAASVAIALLVSMVVLPQVERKTVAELPERMAKLVRQERKLPPPPPQVEEIPLPQEEPPEPEPQLVEELPDEPAQQTVVAEVQQPETREQVKSKGILAFRDSFATKANLRPTAQLGSQARLSSAGEEAIGRSQRNMVTSSAPGSSGGINLADISRDVGGGGPGMGGVEVSRVSSAIGSGAGADRPLAGGMAAGRTDEEIQIVFDRYKAALYRLYNRELRKNPTLRGQLVLRLTIEPDGSVSLCQLHQTDMQAPQLAEQVVTRVSNFDFGAKPDIAPVTIIYPIDFLPAA